MKILKYPLAEKIALPIEAQILKVAIDPTTGGPALWALVDPDLPCVDRYFAAVKTGQELPETERLEHLETLLVLDQAAGKAAVTHILEIALKEKQETA
jgi:hypothetical protein